MAFLSVECAAKSFGDRRVLTSASMHAIAGQVLALVGRNGAGKSTLLRIAAGGIQPDGGSVRVAGRGLENPSLAGVAREGVFFLPDHDLLSPRFTVRRQLEMFSQQFARGGIAEAAELMRITPLLDRLPSSLSGGELRRAESAIALVRQPLCLLADEPFRGIAPLDHEMVALALRTLAVRGCAVVFTGHEIHTVLAACDRVTWCTAGTTHELGTPAEAVRDPRFRLEYLGPTMSARLA